MYCVNNDTVNASKRYVMLCYVMLCCIVLCVMSRLCFVFTFSAMNYGSVGWFIGHEMTHGFDDTGKQTNKQTNCYKLLLHCMINFNNC